MVELEISLGTILSVLIALCIWEILRNCIESAAARKKAAPPSPATAEKAEQGEETEKDKKNERMLEGFDNLMSYDLERARAAARGELE